MKKLKETTESHGETTEGDFKETYEGSKKDIYEKTYKNQTWNSASGDCTESYNENHKETYGGTT